MKDVYLEHGVGHGIGLGMGLARRGKLCGLLAFGLEMVVGRIVVNQQWWSWRAFEGASQLHNSDFQLTSVLLTTVLWTFFP